MDFKSLYKDKKFGEISFNEPLKKYTNFGLGGPCDILVMPSNEDELKNLLAFNYKNNIESTVIGNGSNIIITDKGIRGCVIYLAENYDHIVVNGNEIKVLAGTALSKCAKISFKHSLTGMEEISGIPGTIGGAVSMNAGAYNKEIKDIVKEVTLINKKGEILKYSKDEMDFSYRHSIVFDENLVISSAVLELEYGDYDKIIEKYNDYSYKRRSKQPLDKKSAGSTFKRPEGSYASKLIDECGLRGFRIGDCQVSEKHCGFIINNGNATSSEMLDFIDKVAEIVNEKTGFVLEREVKVIGEM